jgi:hypothetical protein
MSYDNAEDYLIRAQKAANSCDNEGRKEATRQFIDDKTFKTVLLPMIWARVIRSKRVQSRTSLIAAARPK